MSEPSSTSDLPKPEPEPESLYFSRQTFRSEPSFLSSFEKPVNRGFGEEYKPIINDEEHFVVHVDTSYFNPEDLVVKVDGPFLSLEAMQESSNETNFVKRSCTSRWTLPPDVDCPAITSSLFGGKLTINCPKKKIETLIVPIHIVHN